MTKAWYALTLATALAFTLLPSNLALADSAGMASEFAQTCVASRSIKELRAALTKRGWKLLPLAQSHLEREIAAVTPMLRAQGLESDFTVYGLDVGPQHLELAVSQTLQPTKSGRRRIGCSIYNFDAAAPIDPAAIEALVPSTGGSKSILGDVQVERWPGPFGVGSEMRSVFVPPSSPMKDQLGFSGMMLGTSFLDAAE